MVGCGLGVVGVADLSRDRDNNRRPRNARPRDALGRPLARDQIGVHRAPENVTRTPWETIDEARALFAEGRPFHAHEVFEDCWKAGDGAERELWRGLAQLAVGVTHAARGNPLGARSLLDRAAATLAPWDGQSPYGLDIHDVIAWCEGAAVTGDLFPPI